MNEYDSNRIADLFKSKGYLQSFDSKDTDCYILNTCHIREKATEKVYSDIGRLKKNYKNRFKPTVLVTGCVAQAENDEMLKREPYIDAVVGPQSYHKLSKILSYLNKKTKKINFTDFDVVEKFDKLNSIQNSNSKVSAFITIQEGCDKFCNFCVVPYTRGAEHSRSPEDIINEAIQLVSNGAREITLLGQNVNAYKFQQKNKIFKLSDLILKLENIDQLKRIRYTTSHPKDMTDDLIDCYKYSKKLMPFLHLPVQSGSNAVLQNMNRKHTAEEYLKIVKKLTSINPEIKFSSDFIVGYPGEDKNDFDQTIKLVKEIKFINSFSFIFSPRPGTKASKLNELNNSISKERLLELQSYLFQNQVNHNKSLENTSIDVLVENKIKEQNKFFGRNEYFTSVIFDAEDNDIGKIIKINVEKSNQNTLFGKIKNKMRAA